MYLVRADVTFALVWFFSTQAALVQDCESELEGCDTRSHMLLGLESLVCCLYSASSVEWFGSEGFAGPNEIYGLVWARMTNC